MPESTPESTPESSVVVTGGSVVVRAIERIPWDTPYGYTELQIERTLKLDEATSFNESARKAVAEEVCAAAKEAMAAHYKEIGVKKYPIKAPAKTTNPSYIPTEGNGYGSCNVDNPNA